MRKVSGRRWISFEMTPTVLRDDQNSKVQEIQFDRLSQDVVIRRWRRLVTQPQFVKTTARIWESVSDQSRSRLIRAISEIAVREGMS